MDELVQGRIECLTLDRMRFILPILVLPEDEIQERHKLEGSSRKVRTKGTPRD